MQGEEKVKKNILKIGEKYRGKGGEMNVKKSENWGGKGEIQGPTGILWINTGEIQENNKWNTGDTWILDR